MKKISTLVPLLALPFLSGCDVQSQQRIGGIISQASQYGNPTTAEIGQGLKQALEIGVGNGADRLSVKDGFLRNLAVKILFPPEAQQVEKTLRSLGLNALCDNVITSLNRAAETAASEAKPIFVSAVRQMTLTDATNILLGQNDAATNYFRRVTSEQLAARFSPIVQASLGKVGATKYWSDLASRYNKIPLVKPVNTDLTAYVTQQAIDGLFVEVAKEELKIRSNVSARSTGLLQKVFGYADRNRR
ncbi:DUF4197 domain-containing protein [Pedobacter yulinensis]|uniref:DUF4197 domain-containing protein n=1 Tax=Pedobacter yulinensis TaxID=2126353 RepID=A0A2T3HRP0_9SPHI|nr:DUF4197 domain-containing protein [Pedobacter yulinensis]PST85112.1 DUF4197 domain-containing protein [Pedobacter yulinensis]